MSGALRGLEYIQMWLDDRLADPVSYSVEQAKAALQVAAMSQRIVDPIEVACRSCGAQVGQRCSSMFKGKAHEHKPHYRRKADAALVQQAARAMLHR